MKFPRVNAGIAANTKFMVEASGVVPTRFHLSVTTGNNGLVLSGERVDFERLARALNDALTVAVVSTEGEETP